MDEWWYVGTPGARTESPWMDEQPVTQTGKLKSSTLIDPEARREEREERLG